MNKPATILVVDDVEANRYTLCRMLQRTGFAVKEANNGAETLRLAAEKPDLVILDVNLPDISGYEVCKRLKSDPSTSSIPVLHLSASFVESENRAEGLESGADGYLTYPIEPRELVANIHALLRARRAEQDAREQREFLHVTLQSIGDGVIAANIHGVVIFLNAVAQALTGWDGENAIGRQLRDVFQILHEANRERAEDPITSILRDVAIPAEINHVILIAKDRAERPIEASAAPMLDRLGQVSGVVVVFRDITERSREEERRRASEERLQTMIESVRDYAIFAVNQTGCVTTWNVGAERLFGYSETEIVGKSFTILYTAEDIQNGVPQLELTRALAEGRANDDRWHVRQDGTRFFANGSVTPMRDTTGSHIGFTKVARDVTDRKRANDEIARLLASERQQSERMRQVAAAALTVNASLTTESILGVITEEARKIIGAHWGISSTTASPNWQQDVRSVSVSDRYAGRVSITELPNDSGIFRLICRTNTPVRLASGYLEAHPTWGKLTNGDERHLPMRGWLAAPFVGRGGQNLGVLQLSDRFEGEFTEEDEVILIQLALIASVAIENAKLYQELRDADRRKDEFLAILAHELRNPLAPLGNAMQLLQVANNEPRLVAQAANMMERQLEHMVRLVDDLLDLSRVTHGRIDLRMEDVDLVEIVQSAAESSQQFIQDAGHTLTIKLPQGPVPVRADVMRLVQVLMNLLNNAAKYTMEHGLIELTLETNENQAIIRVTDNGIGIPLDMLSHIFEMFTQVAPTLERSQGGLGIGLTLVRTLVDMHGGSIEAYSAGVGQGSEFTVRLPLSVPIAAKSETAPKDPVDEKAAITKKRILAVDDNRDSAESLALLLRHLGNDVKTAHDGPSAVSAAEEFRPDIVLLDIGLPGMNGYEVARHIRRQRGRDVTLIAVTGWGNDEDRRRAHEAGFDQHLVKPMDLRALTQALRSLDAK
jgi:PAS domain S-box-containing protein